MSRLGRTDRHRPSPAFLTVPGTKSAFFVRSFSKWAFLAVSVSVASFLSLLSTYDSLNDPSLFSFSPYVLTPVLFLSFLTHVTLSTVVRKFDLSCQVDDFRYRRRCTLERKVHRESFFLFHTECSKRQFNPFAKTVITLIAHRWLHHCAHPFLGTTTPIQQLSSSKERDNHGSCFVESKIVRCPFGASCTALRIFSSSDVSMIMWSSFSCCDPIGNCCAVLRSGTTSEVLATVPYVATRLHPGTVTVLLVVLGLMTLLAPHVLSPLEEIAHVTHVVYVLFTAFNQSVVCQLNKLIV